MARICALVLAGTLVVAACAGDGAAPTTDDTAPATTSSSSVPADTPGETAPSMPPTSSPTSTAAPPPTSTAAPPPTSTTAVPVTEPPTTTIPIDELQLGLEVVAEGFVQPVLALSPPGDDRLFVVDQPGRVWIVSDSEKQVFLDIRDPVRFRNEQGLLGMAFHPDYAANGLFYVYFTGSRGNSVIAEFSVDPDDPNRALPGSRRDVMVVSQPASNHNGGMIAFGPDGLLWIGFGDGGGANDRYRNGQRSDRRLASMVRIAVGPGAPEPFGLPDDGPFVEEGGLPEVWSIGLRNPWRWAFDGDDLYIADVGQNAFEEINVVPADAGGLNFGWPILEGDDCFRSGSCDRTGLQLPVRTYSHRFGCSITGGFVYRGETIPELDGHYFFGDYCSGFVTSIVVSDGAMVERHRWFEPGTVPGLTSFGIDARGEIYVMSTNGTVYRIVRG